MLSSASSSIRAVASQEGRAGGGTGPMVDMQVGAVVTAARSLHSCMLTEQAPSPIT